MHVLEAEVLGGVVEGGGGGRDEEGVDLADGFVGGAPLDGVAGGGVEVLGGLGEGRGGGSGGFGGVGPADVLVHGGEGAVAVV